MKTNLFYVGASAMALICGSAAASAQDVTAAGTVEAPADSDIVVTANKREQKLNDVGATLAAFGGDELKARQINSLQDLALAVPGLSYSPSPSGTPVYTLRGVGFNDTSLAAYPTVSVYQDEMPMPFSALTRHSAYDLERVEILKGPQGTLFGQNSTGGAINYIAAKPTDHLAAGFDVTYGRFNQIIGEAYVSGPISPTLKMRLAGRVERMDGWQTSNTRPSDTNGKQRNYMGRLLVDFTPSETVRFSLGLSGWKDRSDTIAPQYAGYVPQHGPIEDPAVAAARFSPESPRAADWTPGVPYGDIRQYQATLRGDIELSGDVTLTTLTSYIDYKHLLGTDGDGLPQSLLDLTNDRGRAKSFFQEARLSNGSRGTLRWVLGANYESDKVDQTVHVAFPNSSSNPTLDLFFGYPITQTEYFAQQRMKIYAGFGNVEFDVGSKLTLKAGARYTEIHSKAQSCNFDISGNPKDTGPFIFDVILGGAFGAYKSGECFPINDQGTTIGSVAAGAPGLYVANMTEHNISWKTGLDFKPAPGILLYANVGKGYKAGGFPLVSGTTFTSYLPVRQESVMAYEAGFKASLLDRALQLNGAAFYYGYNDKQLRSKVQRPPFGILDALLNIPKSKITGFEIEATAKPIRGLTLSTAFTYLNGKIKNYTGLNFDSVMTNFAGTRMPFTPKYQVSTNFDYDFPINTEINAFVGAGINYRSGTLAIVGGDINPAVFRPAGRKLYGIDDYTLVDLRAGIRGSGDKWRFSVFGKNIFNKYYWNSVTGAVDAVARYPGMSATYGATLSVRY